MLSLVLAGMGGVAQAALQMLPEVQPTCVFGGGPSAVSVTLSNGGEQDFTAEMSTRIYQASSATAAPVSEAAWKTLRVLPQQIVLESARLEFPAVKAETKFLVQWLESTNRVLGTTEVLVYATNLCAELKPLLGEETLGVLDPNNELKPLLQQNGVAFVDLAEMALEDFSGKLAIVGPFHTKAQMREGLGRSIQTLAKHHVAVVWLMPPPEKRAKLMPSFYPVPFGTNAVVVAQAELVSRLPENPQAQLNLIHFCQLALQPQSPAVPDSLLQP
jgi:hypothetical protein